jgi:hypothetical protein
MHVLWSSAHADDNSGPGGLLLEEIPGILNIGADREPVAGEITIRQPQGDIGRRIGAHSPLSGQPYGDSLALGAAVRLRLPLYAPSREPPFAFSTQLPLTHSCLQQAL